MSDRSQLWLWIMDYLSSFPQIDVSILNGLIETAPMPTDILGEATEMLALRGLEDILQFLPENVAPPDTRVEFDLSLSCSDVLNQIQQEISLSNPTTTEQGLLRSDIQLFIKHKRASLPECALEQMKGLILEEGNNVLDGDGNTRTSSFEDGGALPEGHGGDAGEDNAQDYPSRSVNSTSVDENENGRPNIVAIKSHVLSLLRGRPSRDPVGEASCTQQNLCIICNENGQVLVCSRNDCRLMVHESCLGTPALFDDKCNFLCPFCAYSLSCSNLLGCKDRISSLSKDLSALMKHLVKNLPEIRRVLPSQ
ncbi:hypothetical protein like AT1G68030 [Hibiscus trionum]|uniref:PHD-type domain-containing protein n=1 Tax=Hibiscus trionum TaxID=183268 RepID=A0A9W7JHH4_HIBTR|nr:hypothetical protein like AT1G68030 [Hibiscus trionum]